MRTRVVSVLVLAICVVLPVSLFADFQYTETSKITGGSLVAMMKMAGAFSKQARQANEPTTSAVLVKGNRMARIGRDSSEIIDLDKETITRIDNAKKTYTVMTFEQMKQQMEEAARKARERQARGKSPDAEQAPQMSFDVKVRNTGATKQVAGLNAGEAIITMTLQAKDQKTGETGNIAMTNDMWMAPEIPGYNEVREFERKMALKFGGMMREAFGGAMLAAMQPGSNQGMAEMVKEMSKLKGTPVLQVMRIGTTANGQPLPAASEAALPESNAPEMPSAGEVAKESAKESVASSITGKLGGLGGFSGFGRKKKKEEPAPQSTDTAQKTGAQTNQNAAVLIESNIELSSFSSAPIEASKFDVPAGYKQVEAKME